MPFHEGARWLRTRANLGRHTSPESEDRTLAETKLRADYAEVVAAARFIAEITSATNALVY